MKRIFASLSLLLIPLPLLAGSVDTDALIGGAVGGTVGAVLGSELAGRQGAILGAAVGGAAGTALTTRRREPQIRREVIYVHRPVRREVIYVNPPHGKGLHLRHYKHKPKYQYHYHD
jgi:uncharacterized membrane protein YfcA